MAAHRLTRPRRARRVRRGAGFTLIEVLVALVVTAIGLTGIAALTVSTSHGVSYARHATEATILAEDQLERIYTWPRAQLVTGGDRVDAQGRAVTAGGYRRAWTVVIDGELARLQVVVTWAEGDGDRSLAFAGVRLR